MLRLRLILMVPSFCTVLTFAYDLEGMIRNSENLNGRVVDHAIYGIQSAQWLALTAAET